jgi:RNA polymerase sigma factor (sigma-70 family)
MPVCARIEAVVALQPWGDDAVGSPEPLPSLVARAADGDEAAWAQIVDRFTNLLWSIGRSYRLDAADITDVMQTTWLLLLENLGKLRDPDRLGGWLATTARHECLRVVRRTRREAPTWTDDALDVVDGSAPIDQLLLDGERDAALWRCFEQLSARCRQLLRVLMASEPKSYAEISEALGVPVGSIGPTRMRCLAQLREIASGSGYAFRPAALEGDER